MKSAVYRGPQRIVVDTEPDKSVGDDDLLLAVELCGVCGSDVASYQHGHYVTPGQVLGHEMSATVVAHG